MRQQFGMAGIFMARGMQRFLGERRGADGLREPRLHDLHGLLDIAIGRLACRGRYLAERQIARHQLQVKALHGFRRDVRILGIAQRVDLERHAGDPAGRTQAVGIADHQRLADRLGVRQRQRLHDNLGPDAGRIAHGDRNGRTGHVKLPLIRTARRRSLMRTRLSLSPNAPALVATGTDSLPRVRPSDTPGSISSARRMPFTPKRDSSTAAVSPPVAAKAPIAGATERSASARPCESRGPSDKLGSSFITISISASPPPASRCITSAASDPRLAPPSSSISGATGKCATDPVASSSRAAERDAPASEPTTIRVPEALAAIGGGSAASPASRPASACARPALPMKNVAGDAGKLAFAITCRSWSVSASQTAIRSPSPANAENIALRWPPRTVASGTFTPRSPALARTSTRSAFG